MSSLASVAESMNSRSTNQQSAMSGKRQDRRTGRRNDKFLSLWHEFKTTTPAAVSSMTSKDGLNATGLEWHT